MMEKKIFWRMYLMAAFSGMLIVYLVSAWDYHQDSKHWKIDYPACGGHLQSPIAINHKSTTFLQDSNLFIDGYADVWYNLSLMNTGHSVVVELGNKGMVYGAALDGTYLTFQMHFHWGMHDIVGSEHMLNGKRYPMEVHIIHYSKRFSGYEKASKHSKGILAFAFFIESSKQDKDNDGFNEIVENIKMVNSKGNKYPLNSWSLGAFIPLNQSCYYTYKGSFTYPPCLETVTWIIFRDTIHVSRTQIDEFRKRLDEFDESSMRILLGNNFRPLQKLNDRTVYRTCEEYFSDVTSLSWSAVLLMLCQVGIFMKLQ